MYNESFTFSVEDQTNTKQTINNQDMVDTAHDQKDAGEQKTPKRVSLNELILLVFDCRLYLISNYISIFHNLN